jgi:hypothetical protein
MRNSVSIDVMQGSCDANGLENDCLCERVLAPSHIMEGNRSWRSYGVTSGEWWWMQEMRQTLKV